MVTEKRHAAAKKQHDEEVQRMKKARQSMYRICKWANAESQTVLLQHIRRRPLKRASGLQSKWPRRCFRRN